MIANRSQTHRTVRRLPDSHPNRPTRPDPSRPLVSHPSIVSTGSNPTGLWITLGGFVPMMDGGYAAIVGGA